MEQNQFLLNSTSLQQVLKYIPINQRIKLRELNMQFDTQVSNTPLILNMNQYKEFLFKQEDINSFLQKFTTPTQIIFPKLELTQELVVPLNLSHLIKFDIYSVVNAPLGYIETIVEKAINLKYFGYNNKGNDLTKLAQLLENKFLKEIKIGEWSSQIKEIIIKQSENLQSITINTGSNQILIELISLYKQLKKDILDYTSQLTEQQIFQQKEAEKKLNLKEIKFNYFECSQDQIQNLAIFNELLEYYHLKVFHYGTLLDYVEKSAIFSPNFNYKDIQEFQIGLKDSNLLQKIKLVPLKKLILSDIQFTKEIFLYLMKQTQLFTQIDLRESKFIFEYSDTFESLNNQEQIVDVYVNTGINDQYSCQLAQFQFNNLWCNIIYPFKYDLDEEFDVKQSI